MPLNSGKPNQKQPRIGIFAGTFDPVHKGHITFALKAAQSADLDEVYFVPEPQPRRSGGVTHISHRISMLQLATRSHSKLKVLELPDKKFDMVRTWPRLTRQFKNCKLLLLIGSNVFTKIPSWPHVNQLFEDAGVVVGTYGDRDIAIALDSVVKLNKTLWEVHLVEADHPNIAPQILQSSLARGHQPDLLLASVQRYITENWLYVDIRSFVSK